MKYEKLTKEKAIELNGQRVYLRFVHNIDWYTQRVEDRFNIFVDERDGCILFFRTKQSRKGFTFDNTREHEFCIF